MSDNSLSMKIKEIDRDSKNLEPDAKRLPTNTLSYGNRIQRWGNFIAGYSIEFVEQCLQDRDSSEDIVIDPFMGCGTTLLAAKNNGFAGIGFDRHPIFYNLTLAKVGNYTVADLATVRNGIVNARNCLTWNADAETYLKKLFSEDNLYEIRKAAFGLQKIEKNLKPLAIAFFLKSCEAACGAQTDGIYKAPTSLKKSKPFIEATKTVYSMFEEDIASDWYRTHWINQIDQKCFNKSSIDLTEVKSSTIGVCITSPPYLNNFDYSEMTRMHLYLLGWAGSWREISNTVRNDLITNTTTALKGKKEKGYQEKKRDTLPKNLLGELDKIVSDLQIERKTRAGKKEYDYLVYVYYSEMKSVLEELYRTLRIGGKVHWVVADAALYGVHIETQLHTAEIMKEIGFREIKINFLRKRGHRWILNKRDGAKKGLGEYHIEAVKEI